jgi:hypothetical protein
MAQPRLSIWLLGYPVNLVREWLTTEYFLWGLFPLFMMSDIADSIRYRGNAVLPTPGSQHRTDARIDTV